MSSISERIVSLGIPGYGHTEVDFIHQAVGHWRPDIIFDWGTNKGSSARILFESARTWGFETVVHTIDLPLELSPADRDHAGAESGIYIRSVPVVGHVGDGVTVALLTYVRSRRHRPLFFIDGDHSYENVVRELRYIKRVAPSGAMILHDTNGHPGRAAIDICQNSGYTLRVLNSQAGMMLVHP